MIFAVAELSLTGTAKTGDKTADTFTGTIVVLPVDVVTGTVAPTGASNGTNSVGVETVDVVTTLAGTTYPG